MTSFLCAPIALVSSGALADDSPVVTPFADDPTYLSFGAGYFDLFDDSEAAEFRATSNNGNFRLI